MRAVATTSSRLGALLCGVYAFLLTFLVLALFIHNFGVDVPVWDEWLAPALYAKRHAGTLTWLDLWRPHNEHRIPVPRLVFVALYDLFGEWNLVADMAFNALVMAATVGALAYTLGRIRVSPWIVAALVFVLTSPAQSENILFGYQLLAYALNFGAVAAVCAVVLDERLRWWTIAACIAGCAISTGSMASGLGFWPAIGATLVVRAILAAGSWRALLADRALLARLAAFAGAAVLVVTVYLIGYPTPAPAERARTVAVFVGWMARVLSSPMLDASIHWPGVALSAVLWLCVAAAAIGYARRRRQPPYRDRLVLFAGLALVLLADAAIIGFGRGATPYVPSRYTTTLFLNSVLWLVALADLVRWSQRLPRARVAGALALPAVGAALLLVHADRYVDGMAIMRERGANLRGDKEAVAFYLADHSPKLPYSGFAIFPPQTVAQADLGRPELIAELPPDMQPWLTALPVVTDGDAWGADCAYERTAGTAPPAHWGSWRRVGAAGTGRIRVGPIAVRAPLLQIPIAGYVGATRSTLRVEDAADPTHWIAYAGPPPGDTWSSWVADVSAFAGREVVLVGVAADQQPPGWFAFGRPRPLSRALGVFELAMSQVGLALQAVAVTGVGLLVVFAHARLRPRRRRLRALALATAVLLGAQAVIGTAWLIREATTHPQIASAAP